MPVGTGMVAAGALPKLTLAEPKLDRHVVRWGESLDDIALRRGTTRATLVSLNGHHRDEVLRPGTVLLVPAPRKADGQYDPYADLPPLEKPIVVVPAETLDAMVSARVLPGCAGR